MTIIKTNVETYLTQYLGFDKEDVKTLNIRGCKQLMDFVSDNDLGCLWSYPICELDYLLEKELEEANEQTYIYLFGRLWEVE